MKYCDFCGKSEEEVKAIITSKKADICNECVLLCMQILIDQQKNFKEIPFEKD